MHIRNSVPTSNSKISIKSFSINTDMFEIGFIWTISIAKTVISFDTIFGYTLRPENANP